MTSLLPKIGRVALTLLLLLGAVIALAVIWRHYEDDPWTRDGSVQADVVQVAADVSGLVAHIGVRDNQFVHAGDILFTVDQERYAAQGAQADASVASARAGIAVAKAGIVSARATLADAVREQRRYLSLGDLVSREVRDQKITAAEEDRAALAKARASLQDAEAQLLQAEANRRLARVNVDRSVVRAGVSGFVTRFAMRPGDYVAAGSPQFALLDSSSYYVVGYFEETKLPRFKVGDPVRIDLLGYTQPIWGRVDSMSAGITDREQNSSAVLLPNITPTFSWIRLAQRVPVRVAIDRVPAGLRLIAGRTATVTILPRQQPTRTATTTRSTVATGPAVRTGTSGPADARVVAP